MKIFLRILLLIIFGFPVFSQTNLEKVKSFIPNLDLMFKDHAKKSNAPGMVYGLMLGGKLIHVGQTGLANIQANIKADETSVFRIASMTKSITTLAILKLRDAGKLKLDDPVYLYIPELSQLTYSSKDAPVITIRHLMTHGAGFPEDNPWGDRQLGISEAAFSKMLKKGISFSNAPGKTYEYSNMGFAMLGSIIKKVAGISYQKYIQNEIFKPLGMNHTYWEYSDVPKEKLAHGYRWLNNQWIEQPMEHDGAYGAMGGLMTTLEDFSKITMLHVSAWPERDDPEAGPLKRSSLREMQFPWNLSGINAKNVYPNGRVGIMVNAYGYGLSWTRDDANRTSISHSGGLPGFGSNWRIYPDYELGIISFSNVTYAPTGYINLKVADSLFAFTQLKPREIEPSAILLQRQQQLMTLLPTWEMAEKSGIFAENFFLDYFPKMLREEAEPLFLKIGKIISVKKISPENNLRGTFIVQGSNGNLAISFTLSPENPALIQEYHMRETKK